MMRTGYLVDWKHWFPDEDNFRKLTHINYAFAQIANPLGTVVESFERAHQIKQLKEKINESRKNSTENELTISLSISGWGAKYFSETAANPDNRARFIESALKIVDRYDFDGIDIDWEYPCVPAAGITASPDDKQNFTLLLKELREALDTKGKETGKRYLLSIAVGAQMGNGETVELDKIVPLLDYIHVMTYDLHLNGESSHHTNLFPTSKIPNSFSASQSVEQFIENGVPAEKLLLGIAFYGRGGNGINKEKEVFGQPYEREVTYTWTKLSEEMLKDQSFKEYWDEEAQAPYAYNNDIFMSYDNKRSVEAKVNYAIEKGLAGVFFWEYKGDYYGELIQAIYETSEKHQ